MEQAGYVENYSSSSSRAVSTEGSGNSALRTRPAASKTSVMGHTVSKYRNRILSMFSVRLLDGLSPFLRHRYLVRDECLFEQESDLDAVYFPESAVLSELHMLEDGRMVEVAMMGSESSVGVATVFGPRKTPNFVQVCQPGTALCVDAKILRKHLLRDPSASVYMEITLQQYIRQLSQRSVCNLHHSVEERFCSWLLMLQDRCHSSELKLTHEQVARSLGVHRPSFTCVALAMRERGMIDYFRGKLRVIDRDLLESAACSCYSELGLTDRTKRTH